MKLIKVQDRKGQGMPSTLQVDPIELPKSLKLPHTHWAKLTKHQVNRLLDELPNGAKDCFRLRRNRDGGEVFFSLAIPPRVDSLG